MAERPKREKVLTAADLKRKADRDALKAAREGKKSRLDSLVIEDEAPVYDVLDEDQYEELVRTRRQREDFVVDDEGLGYYDDGEEHAYEREEEAAQQARNAAEKEARKKAGASTISAEALRKARRLGQLSDKAAGGARGGGAKEGLFKYVQRAGAAVGPSSRTGAAGGGGGKAGGAGKGKEGGGAFEQELESQLSELLANPTTAVASSASRRPLATPLTAGASGVRPLSRPRPLLTNPKRLSYVQRTPATAGRRPIIGGGRTPAQQQQQDGGGGGGYYDDDGFDMHDDDQGPPPEAEFPDTSAAAAATGTTEGGKTEEQAGAGEGTVTVQAKSRFSRQRKAIEAALPGARPAEQQQGSTPIDPVAGVKVDGLEATAAGAEEEDDPYSISAAAAPSAGVAGGVRWEEVVRADGGEGEEGEPYVPFFWVDAHEQNGVLYLFGKVKTGDGRFVSAACSVQGVQHSLLVLPRRTGNAGPDGKDVRFGMQDVYKEVHDLLVPGVIPKGAGHGFKCKPVKRRYAFEVEDVPREETEYLKVVYAATYGLPSPERCEAGGRFFERIFGSRTTALERFILKRQLMGPSWIHIKHPQPAQQSATIAKFEFTVADPKHVLGRISAPPPAPPLVVMSLALKTVVNPASQLHEVVAVSTMVHTAVNLDGPTDTTPQNIRQVTAVRPLGSSAGSGYPQAFPHDMARECEAASRKTRIQTQGNERALLSWFFQRLQVEDPDVVVGHNLLGFELEVLLARATTLKVAVWHKIGRLRRAKFPNPRGLSRDISHFGLTAGRLMADTYLTAREHLRETTYSLTHLAASQLRLPHPRVQIDPMQVPSFFGSAKLIVNLAQHTAFDAQLVQRLALKLQLLPLTKQLTNISGNMWARTIKGNRAERIEYLLLHEFHNLKFVTPERHGFTPKDNKDSKQGAKGKGGGKGRARNDDDADMAAGNGGDDDDAGNGGPGTGGGRGRTRGKPAYAGGLVLEPKKGLYDSYILLLDFNSLYPSIIQEYNLCFTTIQNWPAYAAGGSLSNHSAGAAKDDEASDAESLGPKAAEEPTGPQLPPLPDTALEQGILPRVIKTLVDRRAAVKKLLKAERDPAKREQLDVRQKALKLTANSMYGCLGFAHSRFFARPIAALVTAMGRETLQRTVDIAQNQLSLDVIYGDTDSIMINTAVPSRDEFESPAALLGDADARDSPVAQKARLEQELEKLREVKAKGQLVKQAVNKLYRSLELELDGIFKCMLLLKKKKYAALTVSEAPDGNGLTYAKELKGLDLVRRDWCVLSKATGRFVIDQILSGENRDAVVATIHTYLEELAKKMRAGEVPVREFAITKGLNKAPHEYPDAKAQPHLQVALAMMKAGKPVNVGDHIEYVICEKEGVKAAAERAFHPDDVELSEGELKVDVEWYLTQQILPPIARLCEPIEGTSLAVLAERLGLDKSRFAGAGGGAGFLGDDAEGAWGFTPACKMDDAERFKDCAPLRLRCTRCQEEADFPGVYSTCTNADGTSTGGGPLRSGLLCPNPSCQALYWGAPNAASCFARLFNKVTLTIRAHLKRYYDCWLVCDDAACGRRTRQQSLLATVCMARGCHGHVQMEYGEKALHTQLKYLETLFDVKRAKEKKVAAGIAPVPIPEAHTRVLSLLHEQTKEMVSSTAYNWIRPSLWTAIFGGKQGLLGGGGAAAVAGR